MTCSTCKHYHPFYGEPRGECWYYPPTQFPGGTSLRTKVRAAECCAFHAEGTPTEKTKHTNDTPGLAAKVRRIDKQQAAA
jgi:hypothetical protein